MLFGASSAAGRRPKALTTAEVARTLRHERENDGADMFVLLLEERVNACALCRVPSLSIAT